MSREDVSAQAGHPSPNGAAPRDVTGEAQLVTDPEGVIREVSPAAAALLAARREALVGKPLPLLVCEARRQAFYALLLRLRKEGGGARDWPARLKLGRAAGPDVLIDATAVAGEGGELRAVHWALREARLLAGARRALRAERDFSDSLLNTARVFVLLIDRGGRAVRVNPHLLATAERDAEALQERGWLSLVPAEERPAAREALRPALERGLPASYTGPMLAGGGRLTVAWSAVAVPHEEGGSWGVLLVGHDVTELVRAQEKLVQAERLAAIGQVVASLAHESRNLLQRGRANLAMLGWRVEGQPEALELVARVQAAMVDLTRLFEDLRGYAAPLVLEMGPTHLGQVLREAWAKVVELFAGREAELHDGGVGADGWCRADPFRLGQVFRILLENSFEACPGPVRVEVACAAAELAGRPALRLAIRDNGPGLTPEQRQRLCEPFYTTKAHGSGLGMAIAMRIVDAHGGRLEAGDDGPPGAEIVLTLPRN